MPDFIVTTDGSSHELTQPLVARGLKPPSVPFLVCVTRIGTACILSSQRPNVQAVDELAGRHVLGRGHRADSLPQLDPHCLQGPWLPVCRPYP